MPSSLAFVFPGQGSQSVGMLSALAQASPEVEQTFTEASDRVGFHLWDLVRDGPQERLDRTENTQPALLTASVAVWRAWKARGGAEPAYLAGHSLGEYSALVCAGVLSLGDAVDLVAQRGQLMQEAVPEGVGAMAAVLGGEDETVIEVCGEVARDEVVAPANFNCPGQVVIAGHAAAVERVLRKLGELGVKKSVTLPVSVPSHTSLMREAGDRLAERMQAIAWRAPQIPVIQNVNAQAADDVQTIREALIQQLYMPVRWSDCVRALAQAGVTRVGECGPGKVLTGLAKRIDRSLDARTLGTPEAMDQALAAWS
jgi:[acyl-carrier-protein] S-malonyltransferase